MKLEPPKPARLFVGALYADAARLTDCVPMLEKAFGPVCRKSPEMPFVFTDYYAAEIGPDLRRMFLVFSRLFAMETLAEAKLRAIDIEERLSRPDGTRTINLDPGYITAANLVLATTKGYSHRVYLGRGVHADVHLVFRKDRVETLPWTYPDYRSPAYHEFFMAVRNEYLAELRGPASRVPPGS